MRFFLDHDVPRHLADLLRRHGHTVELVSEVMSPESGDAEVFAYAVVSSNWPRGVRIQA